MLDGAKVYQAFYYGRLSTRAFVIVSVMSKLVSADAVEETWFRCDDFTDTILGYRQIITLPSTLYTRDSNIDKGSNNEE